MHRNRATDRSTARLRARLIASRVALIHGDLHTGSIMVTLSFYLYGDQAAGTVARETPLWQAWIQERFPMPSEPSQSE